MNYFFGIIRIRITSNWLHFAENHEECKGMDTDMDA